MKKIVRFFVIVILLIAIEESLKTHGAGEDLSKNVNERRDQDNLFRLMHISRARHSALDSGRKRYKRGKTIGEEMRETDKRWEREREISWERNEDKKEEICLGWWRKCKKGVPCCRGCDGLHCW